MKLFSILIAVVIIFFNSGFKQTLAGQTVVYGEITTNTVWSSSYHPYLVDGDLVIKEGVKLIIQPGTRSA